MIATHENSDGAGYCRDCGTTIGEEHHIDCDVVLEAHRLGRLVRPIKCHFCNAPMFYSGDERYEPEIRVSVDTRGGGVGEPHEYGFYAHVRCWNTKMA